MKIARRISGKFSKTERNKTGSAKDSKRRETSRKDRARRTSGKSRMRLRCAGRK